MDRSRKENREERRRATVVIFVKRLSFVGNAEE